MSQTFPTTTLRSGRGVITEGLENIELLAKCSEPAAFGMARKYALDVAEACRIIELELAHYEANKTVNPMGQALQFICDTNSPAEDEAMDRLEQMAKSNPTLNPIFQHLISCVRPA